MNANGGGLMALTEAGDTNQYKWLPLALTTANVSHTTGILPTPALKALVPTVNNTNLNHGCCYHTVFTGPDGFSGLPVLAFHDHNGNGKYDGRTTDHALLLGGAQVTIQGNVRLDPPAATNDLATSTSHTVTATAQDGQPLAPAAGVTVTFTITSGPNGGATGTCAADPACKTGTNGQVSFTYTSGGAPGKDRIVAQFTDAAGKVQTSNTVEKDWIVTKPPGSTMGQRINDLLGIIATSQSCGAVKQVIHDGMEILYGGLRPIPTKNVTASEAANDKISGWEEQFAAALQTFLGGTRCKETHGMALDLKQFVEQMNEVARAVGVVTRQCGQGDRVDTGPCRSLLHNVANPGSVAQPGHPFIQPSFSALLRSPVVIGGAISRWDEDVRGTPPLSPGQCSAVFKETRGLVVRLHFEHMAVVRDPWATPTLLRGTLVPVWQLEWVPAQYVKVWPICNGNDFIGRQPPITKLWLDNSLNFFWKFYGSPGPKPVLPPGPLP